jgi:5-methylthioribose kinase
MNHNLSRAEHLDPARPDGVVSLMRANGWLEADETVQSVGVAGQGNMNLTLRVATSKRSVILKQARPWVERFPSIAAPDERALVEAAFYQAIAGTRVAARLPLHLGLDATNRVNLFEDLGEGGDYVGLYSGDRLTGGEIARLIDTLAALHTIDVTHFDAAIFANRAMRLLNHHHVFIRPFTDDLDLDAITPGLADVANPLRTDQRLKDAALELGALYLGETTPARAALIHGDYYPGSWMRTRSGPRIIDPEFAFIGPPEFDTGVLIGHLNLARQSTTLINQVIETYGQQSDCGLVRRFAGMEIIRRILGVAQVPIPSDLALKTRLLEVGRTLMLE